MVCLGTGCFQGPSIPIYLAVVCLGTGCCQGPSIPIYLAVVCFGAGCCQGPSIPIYLQPVSYKRYFRCINCFLILVYTIHLSLITNLVDPPPTRTIYMKHPLAVVCLGTVCCQGPSIPIYLAVVCLGTVCFQGPNIPIYLAVVCLGTVCCQGPSIPIYLVEVCLGTGCCQGRQWRQLPCWARSCWRPQRTWWGTHPSTAAAQTQRVSCIKKC